MPIYRCIIPQDSLNNDQRQKIATAFTDVHCSLSAAPRNFVNVMFMECGPDEVVKDTHGSGELKYDTPYFIAGGNRGGRPPELKAKILEGLLTRFCEIAEVDRGQVSGIIREAPASWAMEAGEILPEPGEEGPEWYENSAA